MALRQQRTGETARQPGLTRIHTAAGGHVRVTYSSLACCLVDRNITVEVRADEMHYGGPPTRNGG